MDLVCCYLPDFPASAYARRSPDGAGAVVLAGGRVVSTDRAARRRGVEAGITAGRARALAPEAALHLRDAGFEAAAWEGVLADFHALTPFLEDIGPGWIFLKSVEREVLGEVAGDIGAGIGGAQRRADARLAALRAAPGHLLFITPKNRDAFLQRFPVDLLGPLGFEEDLLERLGLLGYRDLAACSGLTRRQLDAQFGSEGVRLYDLLHPEDDAPVGLYQPPAVISETLILDDRLREPAHVEPLVETLVDRACERLGELLCGRVTLTLLYEAPTRQGRILRETSRDPRAIRRTALYLLHEILQQREGEIAEVGIELGSLSYGAVRQGGLFRERPSVYSAARRVHRRYPGSLIRGVVVPHALFEEEGVYFEPFPEAASRRRKRSPR